MRQNQQTDKVCRLVQIFSIRENLFLTPKPEGSLNAEIVIRTNVRSFLGRLFPSKHLSLFHSKRGRTETEIPKYLTNKIVQPGSGARQYGSITLRIGPLSNNFRCFHAFVDKNSLFSLRQA